MNKLTARQLNSLNDYAVLGISLEQLLKCLGDVIDVKFTPQERRVSFHYDNREPAVHISLQHIKGAMDKQARGEVTTEQLSDWAALLLADPSFDWEGPDEDEIAGWLNEMALLRAPRSGGRAVYEHIIDPSGITISFVQKV